MIQLFIFLRFIKEACEWPYKNKFKKSTPTQDEEFELPDDLIPSEIFRTILIISSRSMKHLLINRQFKYISTRFKTELQVKIKNGCYLEHLTIETMKLLKRRLIKEKED